MDLASLYGGVLPIHPDLFALTDFSKCLARNRKPSPALRCVVSPIISEFSDQSFRNLIPHFLEVRLSLLIRPANRRLPACP
jgi:hypothetical protein